VKKLIQFCTIFHKYPKQMPFDPEIQMEKHQIEAWGLWWVQWQTKKKEHLRRHTMSMQVRLREFEAKHLVGSAGEGLLRNTAGSTVLPPM